MSSRTGHRPVATIPFRADLTGRRRRRKLCDPARRYRPDAAPPSTGAVEAHSSSYSPATAGAASPRRTGRRAAGPERVRSLPAATARGCEQLRDDPLGLLATDRHDEPVALRDRGDRVHHARGAGGWRRTHLRACSPSTTILESPRAGSMEVQAKALNDRGDIVGFADSNDGTGAIHAILWKGGKRREPSISGCCPATSPRRPTASTTTASSSACSTTSRTARFRSAGRTVA